MCLLPASLWSVVTLGMGSKQKKVEETDVTETLLANQSLLLLLVLTNHCTLGRGSTANPYREALLSFTDSNGESDIAFSFTDSSNVSDVMFLLLHRFQRQVRHHLPSPSSVPTVSQFESQFGLVVRW